MNRSSKLRVREATAELFFSGSKQTRRFPPPWSVEELDACFVVKDNAGQNLNYASVRSLPRNRQLGNAPRLPNLSKVIVVLRLLQANRNAEALVCAMASGPLASR